MNTVSRTFLSSMLLAGVLSPASAFADSAFYIGVAAGAATIEAELSSSGIPNLPASIDEDDTATKIFAGIDFDLPLIDLGVEIGYVDFGKPDVNILGNSFTLDSSGIHAWGIASIDVLLIDIYAKLGVIAWEVDGRLLNQGFSDDGTDLGYGIGAAFELGPLEARGEFEVYDLDDVDVSMLSLGLIYRF